MEWYEDDVLWSKLEPVLFDPARHERAAGEIEGLLRLVGVTPPAPVLDLCCGVGRHAIELARRGFTVTGVDRTAPYLERARARAKRAGVEVEFVQSDMRAFRRPGAFAIALNLFTSFGYFADEADNAHVLEAVCASLRPGGTFVVDVMGKEIVARHFSPRDWYAVDDYLVLEERTVQDGWRRMANRWTILHRGERFEFPFSHWIYSGGELVHLLRAAGFADIRLYGDYEGAPYDTEARRLIGVAQTWGS